MKHIKILALVAGGAALISCGRNPEENTSKHKGVNLAYMDTTIDPKEDFYNYACGAWARNNPVPESESRWGSFNELSESNNELLRKILEEAAADKNATKGSVRQKIGNFYYTAMDSIKLEKEGFSPLKPELDKIKAIDNSDKLIENIAYFNTYQVNACFSFYIYLDAKKSNEHIAYIGQGGLGLPDRDFYLNDDAKTKNIRDEYQKHLIKTFELLGKSNEEATTASNAVVKIETELAKASMTRVERRDVEKQYNKMSLDKLQTLAPNINWSLYFSTMGANNMTEIIVSQPDFVTAVSNLFKSSPVKEWQSYLEWHLLKETSGKLSDAFVNQNFYFYGTVLNGVKVNKPRWKNSLAVSNNVLGEAVGQAFVEKAFTPESKKRVNEYVDNITAAFGERIKQLDWMGDSTKQKALLKLNSFSRKLGYPDKWKDYSTLEINRDSYVLNYLRAQHFDYLENIKKLGQPIDKTEWGMPPQTVNAYYNPAMNEIVFPAAIMQPPFFDPEADDAVNYGGIGAVIGHELTHGFDDEGSKFSGDGNLENWWTEADLDKFNSKTQLIVDQFNGFPAVDSLNVNGHLTLGENIADLGGLSIAYYAYQKSLEGKPREIIDGLTPEQRFFIGWAQVWKTNMRPEALRQMVLTNTHSPGNYRVLGPLSNMTEFYKAFDVKPGNKMYREDSQRAKIW